MPERQKVTLMHLYDKMRKGQPITMITCYDYPMADLVDKAGIDIILVGDSLGMSVLGYDSTLPVTQDVMMPLVQAVRRGSPHTWLIGDMPYMTYQPSVETAIRCAGRFMAEGACDAIKLEGGREMLDRIVGIVKAGIPVMGHLGLTPQSASSLGGFKVQGRSAAHAKKIVEDARLLEEAGCYSILLEMVPDRVADIVTQRASIPIIGIGSGPCVHGQVLIFHDMLGLNPKFKPKMVKVFAEAGQVILNGLKQYAQEVENRQFPQPENWFTVKDEQLEALHKLLEDSPVNGS